MQGDKKWYYKALKFYEEEKYSQAIVAIDRYIKINQFDRWGKLLKAIIHGDMSNYDLVFQILEEIKPTEKDSKGYSKVFFKEKGKTCQALGKYHEALKWYDNLVEIIPDETPGYILKGACLALTGNYELAKVQYLKAVRKKGDPDEAFYNLALISRAEMKFEEAKDYCEKSLEIDSNNKSVIHCYEDILKAIKMLNIK